MITLSGADKALTDIKKQTDPGQILVVDIRDMTEAEAESAIAEKVAAVAGKGPIIVLDGRPNDYA